MKSDLTKQERIIYTELLILKEYIKKEDFYNALLQANVINNIDFTGCSYWLTSLFNDLSQKSINLGSKSKLPLSITGVVNDEKPTSNSTWSNETQKRGFISTFVDARYSSTTISVYNTQFFNCAGYIVRELRNAFTYSDFTAIIRKTHYHFNTYQGMYDFLKEYFKGTISECMFNRYLEPKVWQKSLYIRCKSIPF